MSTENTRAEWDNALQLPADKMPLQNLNIDSENLKYYLTHEEYNILLLAVQSLIDDYKTKLETGFPGGGTGTSYWDSYTAIKKGDTTSASDSTLYTSLMTLEKLKELKADIQSIIDEFDEGLDDRYLSKINPDTANELITFLKGLEVTDVGGKDKINITPKRLSFQHEGELGWGDTQYYIDSEGYAHLKGLILEEYLEVPELRYNRIEINVGDSWRAPGGGIIETVSQGSTTGKVYLKLDEGELGAISVNDLCMGIFHFMGDGQSNATQDIDTFSEREIYGFSTSYFKITKVSTDKKSFDYELRTVSDSSYNKSVHPQPGMHFVGFGNTTNVNRQTSSYETRTYQRYLTGRNNWHYTMANIAAQFGDLSTLPGDFSGYSAYLHNVYFSGNIEQLKAENISVNISDSDIRVDKDAAGRYILSNTSTSINIYEGVKELTPLPVSTEENLTLGTYFITTSGTNITPGNSSIEGNLIKFSNVSSMLSDIAGITYHITVKRTTGEIYKLAQTQKISYLKGEPGEPGDPGDKGDGIDYVVFSYAFSDSGETPPYNDTNTNWILGTPSVTAEHKGKYLWIQTKTVYTGEIPTSYTYSVSYIPYDGDGKPGEPGEPGDPGTDGTDSVSITASKEGYTYTFYSTDSDTPKGKWSDGKSTLSVYKGTQKLTYTTGVLGDTNYTVTVTPTPNTSTNGIKIGSENSDFFVYPEKLPTDIINIILTIKVKGITGEFTKVLTYSRLNDGVAGVGVPIVFRGDWSKDKTFYGNDKRMDITKHSDHYWKAKNISGEDSSTGFSGISTEPKESSEYWERFGAEFESVATSLLLAEKANIAEFAFQNQAIYSQNGYMIDSYGNYTGVTESNGDLDNPLFKSNLYLNGKTGELQARTGYVGGFTIHKDMLQSTHGTTPSISLNGRTGKLTANDATIKGHIEAISGTFNGRVTSASSGKKIIIDPATSSLEFEDESEIIRATMGFDDSDADNKHTYLSLQNVESPQVAHKALIKPGYQLLETDYFGGAGNVTTILSDCLNGVLQIDRSGRYGSIGSVKATASNDTGGFLEISKVEGSSGLKTKTEISPTNLKITDSSSNTCEIKVDGMYINGTKSTGSGYTHPSTHPASMITTGTFPGIVKANNNTSYTTKQVRNIILSTDNAVSSQMANGDIWIKYE